MTVDLSSPVQFVNQLFNKDNFLFQYYVIIIGKVVGIAILFLILKKSHTVLVPLYRDWSVMLLNKCYKIFL